MGAVRQRKRYETPRYPWRKDLLDAELKLIGTYGLRNKRELWRHHHTLSRYRQTARTLLAKPLTQRRKYEKELLDKLYQQGLILQNATLDDILALTIEDLLERRLQTQTLRHGLAKTPQQARQLIVHGHISINQRKVTSPSYIVKRTEENTITYTPTTPLTNPNHPTRKTIATPPKTEETETKSEEETEKTEQ